MKMLSSRVEYTSLGNGVTNKVIAEPLRVSRSRFVNSARKKNGRFNRAMKPDGPADRLFRELSWPYDPYFYSLRHHHLGIDKEMAQSKYIYDHLILKAWEMQIQSKIKPPYFFKFEVGIRPDGQLTDLHVHLIADIDAGLLHISRTGEIIKPINGLADFRRRMIYTFKPSVRRTPKALNEYFEALERIRKENERLPKSKQRKRPPKVSGYVWE